MRVIQTEYAGYRFRSRLEARWAVFFDEAEIDFQYEVEGFVLPDTLVPGWTESGRVRYLPDFYLPELGLWCEVKARWTPGEQAKALNAAAHLSHRGEDVLLLPEVFRQPRGGSRRPWLLYLDGDVLYARPWPPLESGEVDEEPVPVASYSDPDVLRDAPDLLRGCRSEARAPEWYREAARTAQRARFEFGETLARR